MDLREQEREEELEVLAESPKAKAVVIGSQDALAPGIEDPDAIMCTTCDATATMTLRSED